MWLVKRNPRVDLDFPLWANRFLNESQVSPWSNLTEDSTVWTPRVDVKETKDAYQVLADLPGLNKNDIQISLHDNVLTVKGERKFEDKKEDENQYYVERVSGQFFRSVQLPDRVSDKDVHAEYKDGVLSVTLLKAEDAKPREIAIK